MQYKCRVTVIDKKCFSEYQEEYLADPKSGPCPFYQVGDEFLFSRYGDASLEKGWAGVFLEQDTDVPCGALCAAVQQAGYTVTRVD